MSSNPGDILPSPDKLDPFSLERLRARSLKERLVAALFRRLLWPVLRLLQIFAPFAHFRGLTIVTRHSDVAAVLADAAHFRVPFGPEMSALAGGSTFVLGLDGPDHARQRTIILQLIKPATDLPLISALSRTFSDALLDAGKGRIDIQRDLMTRVAAETCCRYMGLSPRDIETFIDWTLAASNLLFADPQGGKLAAELGAQAGAGLRGVVDAALSAARSSSAPDQATLAGRLAVMEREPGGPSAGESRAILIGLLVGFVPTNALAGGKMLAFLARHRRARADAVSAAVANDEARLRQVLLEAARLDPALAPGQWRWCPNDADVPLADGRTHRIKGGTVVLAATMAALRDPRFWKSPGTYDPDRIDAPELLFGHMAHHCIGKELALAQIVPTAAALLARPQVSDALENAKTQWLGPFPDRCEVTYSHISADPACRGRDQNGVLFFVRASAAQSTADLNRAIDQAMARIDWRSALDGLGTVHFLSITGIEIPAEAGAERAVLLEINCDGPPDASAQAAIAALSQPLQEIFAPHGLGTSGELWPFLHSRRVNMHGKPWGATGLTFYGLPGLSVKEIAQQAELAAFARQAINLYQKRELGRSSRPAGLLMHMRRLVRQDPRLRADSSWADLANRAKRFDGFLLKPNRQRFALSDWDDNDSTRAWSQVVRSDLVKTIAIAFAGIWLFATALLYLLLDPGSGIRFSLWLSLPWLLLQGFLSAAIFCGLVAGLFVAALRYKEARDPVYRGQPSLAKLRLLAEREDLPGHVKNHITVVTPLKKGLLRRLSLAFALWGIGQLVTHFYRPGFVLSMGTIQFARWVRLPGTGTMIFQSNYDGTWESYLEDFITRANEGQSAAWSNAEGFPRTRFLIYDGAKDGDSFKHYVRDKQVPTAFWYSRFPDLTADQIRRNAVIHDGLARASSDSEARAWLSLFGSAPRTEGEIESEEVQSIVFTGFGKHRFAQYMMFEFPEDRLLATTWLRVLTGYRIDPAVFASSRKGFSGVIGSMFDPSGWLRQEHRVSFGEAEPAAGGASIALSARGMQHLLGASHPVMDFLPGPFAMSMEGRAQRLGDTGTEAPDAWQWSDGAGRSNGVDVVLALFAPNEAAHAQSAKLHRALAQICGLKLIHSQIADPLDDAGFPVDHFGFRDGVVQPIIEGSLKAGHVATATDVVATGEMIYGYRNAQGYYAPHIAVPMGKDVHDLLPDAPHPAERYPKFGRKRRRAHNTDERVSDQRDFGRNGTFMAIRVLQQHSELFADSCNQAAKRINSEYKHIKGAVRTPITQDWVAAKLVGRWQSGATLIGNPTDPARAGTGKPGPAQSFALGPQDYALAFGQDDPRGLQCPLGAHVRRANPRDSFQPDDEEEVAIVNRHRLLRRGRNYRHESGEKGLFFIALCADLERQFEFVQRTWLQADGFHDLSQESDPLIGQCPAGQGQFTIPTAGGAITVTGLSAFTTLRGGGYFFVPSRSALLFMAHPSP